MTLKNQMATDAVTVFLNEDEFAESIVYMPREGGQRTISAIVNRSPPADMNGVPYAQAIPVYHVQVANNATTGISVDELDTNKDQIELPDKDGGTVTTTRTITKLIEQDSAMLLLEVR